MKRFPLLAGGLAAVAIFAPAAAPPARADVLRMENGRSMHGTVDRAYVDEEGMRIQLYATGGTVRVRWEHLIPEDREKWQVDLGLKQSQEEQQLRVDALRFYFEGRTGETQVGVVQNPESLEGGPNATVTVRSGGKDYNYPRGLIKKMEPVRVDASQVHSPQQLYDMKRDEMTPNNGESHFDLADYARLVGAYDRAKEHYLKAKDDKVFADTGKGRQIDSRLATLEILIKNAGLRQELVDIRNVLNLAKASQAQFVKAGRLFLQARVDIKLLSDRTPDPKVQKEFKIQEAAKAVETERRKFFEGHLPVEITRRVKDMLYSKAGEKKEKDIPPTTPPDQAAILKMKGTFEGAKQYATRQVKEDLWKGLIADVGAGKELEDLKAKKEKDPSKFTPEEEARLKVLTAMEKSLPQELKDFWEGRNKDSSTTTSYGYGSFIVLGTQLKLARRTQGGGGRQQGRGGQQQQKAQDVIRTSDEWWEEGNRAERTAWLLSWFAERGSFFEVVRTWEEPCDACAGKGYKTVSSASTGEQEAVRCSLCNGAKFVHKVKWR